MIHELKLKYALFTSIAADSAGFNPYPTSAKNRIRIDPRKTTLIRILPNLTIKI